MSERSDARETRVWATARALRPESSRADDLRDHRPFWLNMRCAVARDAS